MMRLINTIICDDIRSEIANKFSYIGTYDNDIIVAHSPLPLKVPRICFVQYLILEKGSYQASQVLMSPTKEIGRVDFIEKANVISDVDDFVIRVGFENIIIDEFGNYELQLYLDGRLIPELTYKFKIISSQSL